jgi:hypothetical protein
VPLGLALTWAYAFLLTETGVYSYSGCSFSQRGNATLTPECQQRMPTMLSCRTDVSNALSTSAWFRFPYPFQWGVPTFHWQTGVVMMVASVIASVDSVSNIILSSLHSCFRINSNFAWVPRLLLEYTVQSKLDDLFPKNKK